MIVFCFPDFFTKRVRAHQVGSNPPVKVALLARKNVFSSKRHISLRQVEIYIASRLKELLASSKSV